MASLSISSSSFLSQRFSPVLKTFNLPDRRRECRVAVSSAAIELAESTISGQLIFDVMRNLQPDDLPEIPIHRFLIADIDPASAKIAIGILGPFFSAFAFLFILRIVMSWYPKLPVEKFPYVIAYAPTEPILIPTRKVIPPLGGVDVTPVVWFGLVSFMSEILVGPQGLLVLLSQQVS